VKEKIVQTTIQHKIIVITKLNQNGYFVSLNGACLLYVMHASLASPASPASSASPASHASHASHATHASPASPASLASLASHASHASLASLSSITCKSFMLANARLNFPYLLYTIIVTLL